MAVGLQRKRTGQGPLEYINRGGCPLPRSEADPRSEAPAVDPKLWHCGGQAMSPYLQLK